MQNGLAQSKVIKRCQLHSILITIENSPSGNSMLGTPWLRGGALTSCLAGEWWSDPPDPAPSENSIPFISGTVSNGGGEVARSGGWGEVALEFELEDLNPETWLEDDITGLHGPTASGAMSTRNRDPGLEVPEPMDMRSMVVVVCWVELMMICRYFSVYILF